MKKKILNENCEILLYGEEYRFSFVVGFMDDDIVNNMQHGFIGTEQEFVDEYCKLHIDKFGTKFYIENDE